jgi:hypothetical protein
MEVKYSFFCEAATTDSSGRLSVLGIFDGIYATAFPAVHPRATFVVVIEGHRSERRRINIVDITNCFAEGIAYVIRRCLQACICFQKHFYHPFPKEVWLCESWVL